MLSLYSALQQKLPEHVVAEVQSYLSFNALGAWRLVCKQAFLDVEAHVRKLVLDMENRRFFGVNIVQEPTGPWLGSAWFQFQSNIYTCKNCDGYQPFATKFPQLVTMYDYKQAELDQLCGTCFMQCVNVKPCSLCHVYEEMFANNTCERCHGFWCEDCSEDVIDMCSECTGLFCDTCLLLDTCIDCQ